MSDSYTITQFAQMLQDRPRVEAYAESMRRTIREGDVVVDIGCGTGYFSLLACQLGARKVYAIEPGDSIELARECARASGLNDRIECIRDISTRIDLPEKPNVVISDLRGALPLYGQHLPSLIDARTRLLAPDGILICQRDTLHAALIDHPTAIERCKTVWESLDGIDQSACKSVATSTPESVNLKKDVRIGPSKAWATIDYCRNTGPHVSGEIRWQIEEPFRANGLCVWFDAELAGGVLYTSGPGHSGTPVYSRRFFPWPDQVRLEPGAIVEVTLEARLSTTSYVWNWETRIRDAEGREAAHFVQSSLLGQPLVLTRLKRRGPSYIPQLDDEGGATRLALTLMDGERSSSAIAESLAASYPRFLRSHVAALDFVALLSEKYSR